MQSRDGEGDGGSGSAALAFEPWFIPDAPLSRASLHVRLSAEHDAAVHPDEEAHGLAKVDTIWQARIAENSRLFNGSKFRLDCVTVVDAQDVDSAQIASEGSATTTSSCALRLGLGLTDYKRCGSALSWREEVEFAPM